MNSKRFFGIILLVVAAILLFLANDASQSFSDRFSNLFTGRFTERTTWMFAAGIVSAMVGLFMLFTRMKARRAL